MSKARSHLSLGVRSILKTLVFVSIPKSVPEDSKDVAVTLVWLAEVNKASMKSSVRELSIPALLLVGKVPSSINSMIIKDDVARSLEVALPSSLVLLLYKFWVIAG